MKKNNILLLSLVKPLFFNLYEAVLLKSAQKKNNFEENKLVYIIQRVKINDLITQYNKLKYQIVNESKEIIKLTLKIEKYLSGLNHVESVNDIRFNIFELDHLINELEQKIK